MIKMTSYFVEEFSDEDKQDNTDWELPVAFMESRHTEKIEASESETQTWRLKERMKTVSVALVLCLNIGVDPPDVVKTQPCARMECWIDPFSMMPHKSLELIGSNLQKQYERWQPRARYRQTLDPCVEEVKKLCISLRKNAKEERVLFHYNGHGVPRPTVNGEIWVFNKTYTQYIPLSIYDLQMWMGAPSIYVYDCSNAGIIVESFRQFATQREQEYELAKSQNKQITQPPPYFKNCIQMAACGVNQALPMNPDLPADLFTSCLTTPIKTALRWFVLQNDNKLVPDITLDLIDKIPGQLNDRRTMLGELNWVFTAITDTIAWNILPRDLFQRLFRQDLLVASLFRNFLLAERIMRSYNCIPASSPKLPPTYQHSMWLAWDLALDLALGQLRNILDKKAEYQYTPFFSEQLTAFQVWLSRGTAERHPPEQLPIVLQVLLSQVHRLRALDLLGRFLDLGPWAVNLALSVGIFPYVLKLLQSSARELRPLLVFIWAKILAVDPSCQADLVRDNGDKYFLSVLSDQSMPSEHRTMAAFVMAAIVNNFFDGKEAAMQGGLVALCLDQLDDNYPILRQWLAICLGRIWYNYPRAMWTAVRDTGADKLYPLLTDDIPEVRAAAVYALGTFMSNPTERSELAATIDHNIGIKLSSVMSYDASPLVRKEVVVALQWLVRQFSDCFEAVALHLLEEDRQRDGGIHMVIPTTPGHAASSSMESMGFLDPGISKPGESMRRVASSSSISNLSGPRQCNNMYFNIWKSLLALTKDPHPDVANMAQIVVEFIKRKLIPSSPILHSDRLLPSSMKIKFMKTSSVDESESYSAPSSPANTSYLLNGHSTSTSTGSDAHSPLSMHKLPSTPVPGQVPYSAKYQRSRKMFDRGPETDQEKEETLEETIDQLHPPPLVSSNFVPWSCKHFSQSIMKFMDGRDPEIPVFQERQWRFFRNAKVRRESREEQKRGEEGHFQLNEQIFLNKNSAIPVMMKFHPYTPHLAVSDKEKISIWNWERGLRTSSFSNRNPKHCRITSLDFVSAHDISLLMVGSDDGAVKLWKNYVHEWGCQQELVSAWQALSLQLPSTTKGAGLVLEWDQFNRHLFAGGDVRIIRIWDAVKEMKFQDIHTGADSCVTSLISLRDDKNVLVAGFGDGSIRVYDWRQSPSSIVMTLRDHTGWVVKVCAQKRTDTSNLFVSGSVNGDLKFWDIRYTRSVRSVTTAQGLTAMDSHAFIDAVACGSVQQLINVYNSHGNNINTIKYYDGFIGQRIGPISCLTFHPYRVSFASGSTDSFISIYTIDKKR